MNKINIIGAGLSGLSCAINLAKRGIGCNLFSSMPSERAQSVLAEGGINAALNTMGENDTIKEHFMDTLIGGVYLEDADRINNLVERAPETILWLSRLGVPFQWENNNFVLRNFGGQKKKRTAYAKSSTGKILMTALIDEARKYEAVGLINRLSHHELADFIINNGTLEGIIIKDRYTDINYIVKGQTILCVGGLNGLFDGLTTGTTQNTSNAAAMAFYRGVELANLEFIQYHPTTLKIGNKRLLITEAARGEGGRLFVTKDGEPYYFMEDKYPELKNLMPRDVVSREIYMLMKNGYKDVYLDMTAIPNKVWDNRLSDLRNEIINYTHKDPKIVPIEIEPSIHYFMGGIHVDINHKTNIKGLYAAGECAAIYHGANRLGGNSMLGAIVGGSIVANTISNDVESDIIETNYLESTKESPIIKKQVVDILEQSMGIIRNERSLNEALDSLERIKWLNLVDKTRIVLAKAIVESALQRKESRGAHYREDYKDKDEKAYRSVVIYKNGKIIINKEEIHV